MKLVLVYDKFGPNGPIPNGPRLAFSEFMNHWISKHTLPNYNLYRRDNFCPIFKFDHCCVHHEEFIRNAELYKSLGPAFYTINLEHSITNAPSFDIDSGRFSWTADIPEKVIKECQKGNLNLAIVIQWSDCDVKSMKKILKAARAKIGSTKNFYIWTSNILLDSDMAQFSKEEAKSIVYFPWSEAFTLYNFPSADTTVMPKEKKFMYLNRRYNAGRILTYVKMSHESLNDFGYTSMPDSFVENGQSLNDYINNHFSEHEWVKNTNVLYKSSVVDKTPLIDQDSMVLKGPKFLGFSGESENLIEYFKKSYFSIVTESRPFRENYGVMITEKTYRTIFYKHPFLIVNRPGSLEALKKLGYKTFDKFWDESYDTEEDLTKRIEKIVNTVKNLCQSDLEAMDREVIAITEHNFSNLYQVINNFTDYLRSLQQC